MKLPIMRPLDDSPSPAGRARTDVPPNLIGTAFTA